VSIDNDPTILIVWDTVPLVMQRTVTRLHKQNKYDHRPAVIVETNDAPKIDHVRSIALRLIVLEIRLSMIS